MRDPRPSVDTIVARSSLCEVIIDVIVFLVFLKIVLSILLLIVIVALGLTILIMVFLAFAWRFITSCRSEKIQFTCHTCGKERVEWYFKARLPGYIVTEPCCSFGSEER